MGREFELKFMASPQQQAAILERFGDFREISMETTYFDTADRALARRHITLRQRMENGVCVCTVKTKLPDGSRGEWELEWQDPTTMVDMLCKLGAPRELKTWTAGGILPICGAKFLRRAKELTVPGGTVELALDQGVLLGGGKTLPLGEVEVELKSGSDTAAVDFARALAERFDLRPEENSKFHRAQQLAAEK